MSDASNLFVYVAALRRWWAVILATTLLGVAVAWVTLPSKDVGTGEQVVADPTVRYRATHILLRARATAETANLEIVQLLASEGEIPALAAKRLGRSSDAAQLAAEAEITVDARLGTVSVTTTQETADEAERVASGYADAITEYFDAASNNSQQDQIEREVERLTAIDERIRVLETEIRQLPDASVEQRLAESEMEVLIDQYGALQASVRDRNIQQIDQPSTFTTLQEPVALSLAAGSAPVFRAPTDPLPRIALSLLVGLVLGVVLVLVIDRFDTRIRTREDAEEAFGLPVLGGIPRHAWSLAARLPWRGDRGDATPMVSEPGSRIADAYRTLGIALRLSPRWQLSRHAPTVNGSVGTATRLPAGSSKVHTLLVTSAGVGEGKSATVANLAASFAETGLRVLVMDCDFRQPSMRQLLAGDAGPGLHATSVDDIELAPLIRPTAIEGVQLLPAGPPGAAPASVLVNPELLVDRARALADLILIDTGPLLVTNEAASLIPHADAVVVVARSGRTANRHARLMTERLSSLHARISGVALVGVAAEVGYGYGPYGADLSDPLKTKPATAESASGSKGSKQRPQT